MKVRKTRIKIIFLLVAMSSVLVGRVLHATEAAVRMPNYDRWKDLPSQALLDMGSDYWRVDKVDSALVCFTILSNRYSEKMTSKEKNNCCEATQLVSALYLNYFFDYQMANRYILKAEQIASENHFEQQLAIIYFTKTSLLEQMSDLDNNYKYSPKLTLWKKAYQQAIKSQEMNAACLSMAALISDAVSSGQVNEIEKELHAFSKFNIPDIYPTKQFVLKLSEGATAFLNRDFEKALEIFSYLSKVHLKGLDSSNSSRHNIIALSLESVVLDSLHRDLEVLRALETIERIATDKHIDDAITEVLRQLQGYYETHGNTALAKEYELKYFKAKDEFINRSKLLSVDQQQFLFELEEMGEEVKDLQAQKRVRDLIIFGIALLALLVIGALVFLWRNYQSTKQRNVLLFQKNQELLLLEAQEKERKAQLAQTKKYKSSTMDDDAKNELLHQLQDILESQGEIYDGGFTLHRLAQLAGTSPNYVSQVINEKKRYNFNDFVNEYRIKEACRRLTDNDKYGDLTIEAIGQSLGFKSRANFASTFKKFTGLTPSAYQHLVKDRVRPQADGAKAIENTDLTGSESQ